MAFLLSKRSSGEAIKGDLQAIRRNTLCQTVGVYIYILQAEHKVLLAEKAGEYARRPKQKMM